MASRAERAEKDNDDADDADDDSRVNFFPLNFVFAALFLCAEKSPKAPDDAGAGRLSQHEERAGGEDETDESKAVALHRAKHGLINAETALTLAVHGAIRQLEQRQHHNGAEAPPDKGRTAFYLSKAS